MKHEFKLKVSGSQKEATQKVKAMATLGIYLTGEELEALANFVKTADPGTMSVVKNYLGL